MDFCVFFSPIEKMGKQVKLIEMQVPNDFLTACWPFSDLHMCISHNLSAQYYNLST